MSDEGPIRHPGDHAQPLPAEAQMRWEALVDTIKDLPGAIDDPEAFGAALAALQQVSGGLDGPQFRDSLHVPEDAGEYADALRRMLARIPRRLGALDSLRPRLVPAAG